MSKHPIIWQSLETNQNGDPFFTVRKAKGYYIYGERIGVDSVAFILLDRNKTNKIGLINEPKPPLGDNAFLTTAFGGSLDKNISLEKIVIEETLEEAGYIVTDERITSVGKALVSTQMNQFCHLFLVDVTNLTPGRRHLDETEFGSTVEWIHVTDILSLELQDWKAPLIYTRYLDYKMRE